MDERNIIGGITAAAMSGFIEFLEPLKWFLLAAAILILVDLRFGIAAAKMRGEMVRFSRAGRRTVNKAVDYVCWILLAGAFGKAFGIPFDIPLLPAIVLIVVFGFEINSCFNNYFEAHGKKFKLNIFSFLSKKVDLIEIEEDKNETK